MSKTIGQIQSDSTAPYDYVWADATERLLQTGMLSGENGLQRDTNISYVYNGVSWLSTSYSGSYDYVVADDAERLALTGMTIGDTIFVTNTALVYIATSSNTSVINIINPELGSYALGETITAGDQVILKTDGKIYKWKGYSDVGTSYAGSGTIDSVRTIYVDTNTIITAFVNSTLSDMIVVAGTISGGVITYGTPVTLDSLINITNKIELVKVDTNSAVVLYKDSNDDLIAHPLTVSGTTITAGTSSIFEANVGSTSTSIDCVLINTNKIFITYSDANNFQSNKVGIISGNTISFGSQITNETFGANYISCCKLNTDKVLLINADLSTSSDLSFRVATISGNIISLGTRILFNCGFGTSTINAYQTNTDTAFIELDSPTDIYGLYVTVSGTTPTGHTPVLLVSNVNVPDDLGRPIIQLNNNIYGLCHSTNNITWFYNDDITYIPTVIKTLNYNTSSLETGNFAIDGIGNFLSSTSDTSRLTYIMNFDSHYLFGIAQESGTIGQSKKIAINGDTSNINSGLSVGQKTYSSYNGTYTLNPAPLSIINAGQVSLIGRPISPTSILVDIPLQDL